MKTLKNGILIYDGDCPMCCAYSKGFVAPYVGGKWKDGLLPHGSYD